MQSESWYMYIFFIIIIIFYEILILFFFCSSMIKISTSNLYISSLDKEYVIYV